MLEKVDLSKRLEKAEYNKTIVPIRSKLSELQRKIEELHIPVIILLEGWGASGKGTLINEIIQPLDPRGFMVYTINKINEDEKLRPFLWKYWIRTPARGKIAIFDKGWYRRALIERIDEGIEGPELSKTFRDIISFEKQLTSDGNIIIKLFLHISKKEQAKRFKKLEGNPATKWRVTKEDWKHNLQYDKYVKVINEMIRETETDFASWTIVESENKDYAIIKILTTIIKAIEKNIANISLNKITEAIPQKGALEITELRNNNGYILEQVDISKSISKEEYTDKLNKYQNRLREIEHLIYTKRIPIIILYEGWDAAGKGGNIKRVTENLDPRGYQVIPYAAPNDIEKAHHYLWRFWNNIPKAGHIAIFDRSWYGRVLVERVESFCSEEEWKRSYKEINDMEEQLCHYGVVVIKFWLHISPEEQLRRFKERLADPQKQWKINEEDWRNRDKWPQYEKAVNEMLIKTDTTYAPWVVVEANSKYYARIKTLKTIIDAIEKRIGSNE